MKIYESSGSVQQQVGGGGFNPVSEPDVASAMERELRAGERRDQMFYNSVTQNNQWKVQEAQQVAERMNNDIDKNLKAISQFSKTATTILDQRTVNKINQDMEAAAQQAWIDPIYAEKETQQFEQDEAKIEEGQGIMDQAAVKYEANGGSPVIGEALRTQFTGRNRVAYERARMERLSYEFPSYYAERLNDINATQDPDVRAAKELAVVNAFLRETGAVGASPGMMNKYLMRNMRKVTSKAQLAWTTEKEKQILSGRLDEAKSELWTGMTSGNISSSAEAFRTKLINLGKSPLEAKEELFKFLLSDENEVQLDDADIEALKATPIDHPAGDTYGKVFGREIDQLEGKVANNQDLVISRNAERRKADQANFENQFDELKASLNGKVPADQLEQVREAAIDKGLDPSFLDNYKTAEAIPLESAKRKLESIWQKQGFLTPNDTKGMPAAVLQDSDVKKWLSDGSLRSGETKADSDAVEQTVKRVSNEIAELEAFEKQGIEYDRIENEVRKDINAQYMSNLQSGKYRNEDGSMNYSQALSDARETVFTQSQKSTQEGGKDYKKVASPIEIAQRGSSRYQQRVRVYKNQMLKDPAYLNNSLFSSNAELDQAQKALMNQGDFPGIYQDLAAGQVNVTPYDIAMAQLEKAGRKVEPEPVEEAVKAQSPELQRLLNFKPNANKTERAFTPNMNDPSVLSRNLKLSSTERGALDALARYESQNVGNYNAVNQIGTKGGHGVLGHSGHYSALGGRNLTSMSVGEIMNLQASRPGMSNAEWIRQGRLHAVGRYQMIGPTFARVVQAMGIKPNQQFTPELQDQMGLWLLRNGGGGINQWVGPANYATASERALIRRAQRGN